MTLMCHVLASVSAMAGGRSRRVDTAPGDEEGAGHNKPFSHSQGFDEVLSTTEGERPQLCLCISSTLLKLLTGSACSQSDDLPCCARITSTSATFANDDKSLFDQRQRSDGARNLRKDGSLLIRVNDLARPT
ncbi:unnamed protein product [Pleuronectes platessa]|uniref:Uncharacterized protein n=1 Tax=Pleuronectes platessa TaxID=8262 RepID=A0A9N7TS48_PLEPL|nr:unnamed protein product [Pleuronectes platessa]